MRPEDLRQINHYNRGFWFPPEEVLEKAPDYRPTPKEQKLLDHISRPEVIMDTYLNLSQTTEADHQPINQCFPDREMD